MMMITAIWPSRILCNRYNLQQDLSLILLIDVRGRDYIYPSIGFSIIPVPIPRRSQDEYNGLYPSRSPCTREIRCRKRVRGRVCIAALHITRRVYDRERSTIRHAEASSVWLIVASIAMVVVIAMWRSTTWRGDPWWLRGEGRCCGDDIISNSLDAATVGGVLSLFLSVRRVVLVASQQCETAANTEVGKRQQRLAGKCIIARIRGFIAVPL